MKDEDAGREGRGYKRSALFRQLPAIYDIVPDIYAAGSRVVS